MQKLKDQIVAGFAKKMDHPRASSPNIHATIYLYEHSRAASPLRKVYVDWWILRARLDVFEEEAMQWWVAKLPDLTRDLFFHLVGAVSSLRPHQIGEISQRSKEERQRVEEVNEVVRRRLEELERTTV